MASKVAPGEEPHSAANAGGYAEEAKSADVQAGTTAWAEPPRMEATPPDAAGNEGEQLPMDGAECDAEGGSQVSESLEYNSMQLEGSAWDAILLLGLNRAKSRPGRCSQVGDKVDPKADDKIFLLTRFQSAVAVITFASAVWMQLLFAMAVTSTMATSPITGASMLGVIQQRLLTNHKLEHMNLRSFKTRAAELCDGNVFNLLTDFAGVVSAYIEPDEPIFLPGSGIRIEGALVAKVAILIWTLSMASELRRIAELVRSLVMLPTQKPGGVEPLVEASEDGDSYLLRRISRMHRAVLLTFVMLPRLIIALLLLLFGSLYLAQTLAVSDMILNCCALEIVKDIDEYLFDAVMSHRMRSLVENTNIMYKPTTNKRVAEYEEAAPVFLRMMAILGWFLFVYVQFLTPFIDKVKNFEDWTCKHDTDFAWEMHPVLGMPFFTDLAVTKVENSSFPTELEDLRCWYVTLVLVLEVRAGFDVDEQSLLSNRSLKNSTLTNVLLGNVEGCGKATGIHNGAACPHVSTTKLAELKDMDTDEFYENPHQCVDFSVHFNVLRETCMDDENGLRAFTRPDGTLRNSCEDFTELCACTNKHEDSNGKCKHDEYMQKSQIFGISPVWIMQIQKMCPDSCGLCSTPMPPGGMPQAGGGTGEAGAGASDTQTAADDGSSSGAQAAGGGASDSGGGVTNADSAAPASAGGASDSAAGGASDSGGGVTNADSSAPAGAGGASDIAADNASDNASENATASASPASSGGGAGGASDSSPTAPAASNDSTTVSASDSGAQQGSGPPSGGGGGGGRRLAQGANSAVGLRGAAAGDLQHGWSMTMSALPASVEALRLDNFELRERLQAAERLMQGMADRMAAIENGHARGVHGGTA